MSEMRGKESPICGRMHIWALKTLEPPGPLSGPWTQAAYGWFCSHDLAFLHWQFLEGILHFQKIRIFCHGNIHILPCIYINYKRLGNSIHQTPPPPPGSVNVESLIVYESFYWKGHFLFKNKLIGELCNGYMHQYMDFAVQFWSATWPRNWFQLTSFTWLRCKTPHRLQCISKLYSKVHF